jgi:rhamnogalacturonyl hydrolase YesR
MRRTAIIILLLCGILPASNTQKTEDWEPIDYVIAVGDRVRDKSLFEFQLEPYKPRKRFNRIEFISFERNFPVSSNAAAYAYTNLHASKDVTLTLDMAFSGSLKLWVNGEEVYRKENTGPSEVLEKERSIALEEQVEINLKKGNNKILAKSITPGDEWKVYLQPQVPRGTALTFKLHEIKNVTPEVDDLSNWFIIGPFEDQADLDQVLPPENEFLISSLYKSAGNRIAWTIPKMEIIATTIGADPLWGTLYDYNYHTAGLAWSIYNLGEFTGEERFKQYLRDYCDFMFRIRPYIRYEKYDLGRYRSRHAFLIDKPLLDFTTAPALPFIYRLRKEDDFENRETYREFVTDIQDYVQNRQLRLDDGTLARQTPEKYTLWADDMFMGIPFLLQSAMYLDDPAEKQKFYDDAARQVLNFAERTFDPDRQLFWHAHFTERPEVKLPYWSRANGWAIWATSEVLLHLPKSHGNYKPILRLFRKHVEGLSKAQDMETGFFRQLLEDPDSYTETSGTAIMTMAIARGINNGWISKKYKKNAVKGWEALTTVMEPSGKVSKICIGTMTSEDPQDYLDRPTAEDDSHGLLGLIFTGIEMQKLLHE